MQILILMIHNIKKINKLQIYKKQFVDFWQEKKSKKLEISN